MGYTSVKRFSEYKSDIWYEYLNFCYKIFVILTKFKSNKKQNIHRRIAKMILERKRIRIFIMFLAFFLIDWKSMFILWRSFFRSSTTKLNYGLLLFYKHLKNNNIFVLILQTQIDTSVARCIVAQRLVALATASASLLRFWIKL